MISVPNMILLGAAGRNVGKTEFACRLIERYAPSKPVVAVKITTIDRGMHCPRGGTGCGVCGSLTEPYCITEEMEGGGTKDTMRMKAAGAHQVLWLRVMREHLREGVSALMQRIPAGVCIVCESNSARTVMEPGVFLIIHDSLTPPRGKQRMRCFLGALAESQITNNSVSARPTLHLSHAMPAPVRFAPRDGASPLTPAKKAGEARLFGQAENIKASCAAVRHLAHREMRFYGDHWDFEPDRCLFMDGRWQVPLSASAAVLAGGQSRRMGQDKSLLRFKKKPLIKHILDQISPLVDEVLIGANDSKKYEFTGLSVIPDERPDQGPLMGILSCLEAARHDRLFITACDIPELPAPLIRTILKRARCADVVIPRHKDGRLEPLLAVYGKSMIPVIRKTLAAGHRRIVAILEEPGLRVDYIEMPPGDWYRNLNTPEEYESMVRA